MVDGIFIKNYTLPAVDEAEVLRYAGQKSAVDNGVRLLLNKCVEEATPVFSCRICYAVASVEETLSLFQNCCKGGGEKLISARLEKAERAVVFAGTVGIEIDRLIMRYTNLSPAKALFFQAIGAERIESLCNSFCNDLKKEWDKKGLQTGTRFSPGYGDFPLTAQRKIFSLLTPEKRIGLTLNDSLLMTPTKSVTAIVPIFARVKEGGKNCADRAEYADTLGCAQCKKTNCISRKKV